jgi:hypothetical protein
VHSDVTRLRRGPQGRRSYLTLKVKSTGRYLFHPVFLIDDATMCKK